MIAETQWKQVRACQYDVAVLPWGATEAHNYHLPYGTDNYQNEDIAARCGRIAWGRGAKVAILPNVPFGVQTGQLDIPFCVNLNPSTQFAMLSDIVASLAAAKVQRFVVLNGHGGNDFRQMLRELQPRHPGVFLSAVSWFQVHSGEGLFTHIGDHADERETSMMLHIQPQLVLPPSDWGDGRSYPSRLRAIREKVAWAQRQWSHATHDTGVGDPRHSTAAKGEAYLDLLTERIAEYLVDLAHADLTDLYDRSGEAQA
jgi:creatinine amidohydrolase